MKLNDSNRQELPASVCQAADRCVNLSDHMLPIVCLEGVVCLSASGATAGINYATSLWKLGRGEGENGQPHRLILSSVCSSTSSRGSRGGALVGHLFIRVRRVTAAGPAAVVVGA